MLSVNKLLGLRIKRLREARGLTQSQLADTASISLKHLGEVERGRGNPTLSSLTGLSHALGITLAELFAFEDEEKGVEVLRGEIVTRLSIASPDAVKTVHRLLKP